MSARKKDATEVALVEAQAQPLAQSQHGEGATVLAMIDRLIAAPNVPVERLTQAFELHQRVKADHDRREFAGAFSRCQKAMVPVVKRGEGDKKIKYATYLDLDAALRPIYSEHGFTVSFNSGTSDLPDHVKVYGYLMHESGHERTYEADIPCDGKGAKGNDVMTKTHARGSAFTYGKRYLLIMIFNIALTDKADDDGQAAGGEDRFITPDQAEELAKLITLTKTDINKFLAYGKVESLSDILASKFESAKKLLLKKAEKNDHH